MSFSGYKKVLHMYSAIIHRSLTCFKREHSFYFLWQEYLSNSGSVEWNILQIQAIGESVLLNCTYRNSSDCRLSDSLTISFYIDTLGVLARTIGPDNFMPLADECVQLGMVRYQ